MKVKELLLKGESLIDLFNEGSFNREMNEYAKNGYKIFLPDKAILSEIEIERQNKKAVETYKANFQRQIYEQLIFLIGVLDEATIFEKEHIRRQVNELIIIFFDHLDSENDTYWQSYMTIFNSKEYNDVVYPLKREEFTKEYVLKIINNTSPYAANKIQENDTDKNWFKIGLKFVDGTVYKYKCTGIPRARKVFEDELEEIQEEKEKKNKVKLYANYLDYSCNFIFELAKKSDKQGVTSHDKNLFKEAEEYEKRWLKIIKHCTKEVSQSFINDFELVYGYDPTK